MITGCSTPTPESKPEYDAVELFIYEECISAYVDDINDDGFYEFTMGYITKAQKHCEKLKPVKK
jgi:tRNA A-37 threonylcarbamoyl transferase component Bud32